MSTAHNLTRAEWERRFASRIETRANIAGAVLAECVTAEIESWPVSDDDWLTEAPEDAADSNLSYWDDDGDPK